MTQEHLCTYNIPLALEGTQPDQASIDELAETLEKLLDHMEQQRIAELIVYWQGGLFSRVERLATELSRARFAQPPRFANAW
jgi:hypothetical protein